MHKDDKKQIQSNKKQPNNKYSLSRRINYFLEDNNSIDMKTKSTVKARFKRAISNALLVEHIQE